MLKSTSLNFISIKRMHIWDQEFKNRQSKICGRQSLKNLKGYGLPKAYFLNFSFKFFKGCLPQILSGPFLNTLSHIFLGILSTDYEVDIFDHFFSWACLIISLCISHETKIMYYFWKLTFS